MLDEARVELEWMFDMMVSPMTRILAKMPVWYTTGYRIINGQVLLSAHGIMRDTAKLPVS